MADSTPTTSTTSGPTPKVKAPLRPIPPWLSPLRFMGVPPSVLRWQPKLPSRNWSIFLSLSVSLTSLYLYDRRECKKIKQKYIGMVDHFGKESMRPDQWPRKVSVYCAKCPGEDGSEEAVIYFKKYVKPILVSAAIDWDLTNGTRSGGLAREITERIYSRRRQLLGLEPFPIFQTQSLSTSNVQPASDQPPPPFSLSPSEQLQRELDGAVVIVGRSAFKEYAWGLRNGWTTPCTRTKIDRDEKLAEVLAGDGTFEGLEKRYEEEKEKKKDKNEELVKGIEEENVFLGEEDGAGAPLPSKINMKNTSPLGLNYSNLNNNKNSSSSSTNTKELETILPPPTSIPAQPPLHLIPYTPLHGWRHIPARLVGFFNHRSRFEAGGKEAIRIIFSEKSNAREIRVSENPNPAGNYDEVLNRKLAEGWRNDDGDWLENVKDLEVTEPPQGLDLDFDLEAESKIPPYFNKSVENVSKSREQYLSNLYDRYKAHREISDGEREPYRSEKGPGGKLNVKSEFELREERFKKEKEWRGEEHGWEIVRLDRGVAWTEKFKGSLRIGRGWDDVKELAESCGRENERRREDEKKFEEDYRKELEVRQKQLEEIREE